MIVLPFLNKKKKPLHRLKVSLNQLKVMQCKKAKPCSHDYDYKTDSEILNYFETHPEKALTQPTQNAASEMSK